MNRKLTDIEQVMKHIPVTDIYISRYTYDSWIRCYPESNIDEYNEIQCPDNMMHFMCSVLENSFPNISPDPSLRLHMTMIDDDYFKWLNGRKNTADTRAQYTNNPLNSNVKKISEYGLNISKYSYALPIIGVAKEKTLDTRLSYEIVSGIRKFITDLIDNENFSVFVFPCIVRCDDFYNNFDIFNTIADEWFSWHELPDLNKYEKIYFKENNTMLVGLIPIFVRETHPKAEVTVGELLSYINPDDDIEDTDIQKNKFIGRILESYILNSDEEIADEESKIALKFHNSDGYKCLMEWINQNFEDGACFIYNALVCLSDIPDFYNFLMSSIEAEAKKSNKTVIKVKKGDD